MGLPEGRLRAIYGAFGGGKSLRLAELLTHHYDDGYRLLLTNLHVTSDHAGFKGGKCPVETAFTKRCPDLKVVWLTNAEIKLFWLHPEYRKGCIVAQDETHLVYDAQEFKDEKKVAKDRGTNLLGYWSQIRKAHDQVYVVSQTFSDIVKFIRDRVKTAERRFGFLGFYCVRVWHFEGGAITHAQKFGRIYRRSRMKKFYPLYMTHAKAGEVFDIHEEEAHFVGKSASWGQRYGRWVAAGVCAGLLGWAGVFFGRGWYDRHVLHFGQLPAPVVAVREHIASLTRPHLVTTHPRPSVVERPVFVAPADPVAFWKGKYYAVDQGDVVLGIKGDTIVLGDKHGGVRSIPRDDSAEYDVIRQQRAKYGGSGSVGASKGTASTDGGGSSGGSPALVGSVLPR